MSELSEILKDVADENGKVRVRLAPLWVPLENLWMHDSRWHKANWPIRWAYLLCAAVLADDQEAIDALRAFSSGPRKKPDRDIVRQVENRMYDTHGKSIMLKFGALCAKHGRLMAEVVPDAEGIAIEVKEAA